LQISALLRQHYLSLFPPKFTVVFWNNTGIVWFSLVFKGFFEAFAGGIIIAEPRVHNFFFRASNGGPLLIFDLEDCLVVEFSRLFS
jgi:hypothetical protein